MTASLVVCEKIKDLLNRTSAVSLQQQLYRELRSMIEDGTLRSGIRLPSTRSLAKQIDVSRITVVSAFDMLTADGYLSSNVGSGTFVSAYPAKSPAGIAPPLPIRGVISSRGQHILAGASGLQEREGAFLPGVPDKSEFPYALWQRLLANYFGKNLAHLSGYANGGGYLPLRRALADHLRLSRGVRCTPDQVLVTMGTQNSLDLIVRLLTDHDDYVCIENPSHWAVPLMLKSLGVHPIAVPVDEDGMCIKENHYKHHPKLVFITPSHQFPMGSILSKERRRQLLSAAFERKFWIVEDDYDSELRYDLAPLPCLQGQDTDSRVIYLGTFSKVMYPGMRMSYMIVPPPLLDSMTRALLSLYRPGHLPIQAALADFILDGHLTKHLMKIRPMYAERQVELRTCLKRTFGDDIVTSGGLTGLHLTIRFVHPIDLNILQKLAAERDIILRRLSAFNHSDENFEDGFVLGYGALNKADISSAVARFYEAYMESRIGS